MATYKVMIRGDGINFEASPERPALLDFFRGCKVTRYVGFYATRYVDAQSETGAMGKAREQIAKELVEISAIPSIDDPQLELQIEDLKLAEKNVLEGSSRGFTFYEQR